MVPFVVNSGSKGPDQAAAAANEAARIQALRSEELLTSRNETDLTVFGILALRAWAQYEIGRQLVRTLSTRPSSAAVDVAPVERGFCTADGGFSFLARS